MSGGLVRVNVYDLTPRNKYLFPMGLGFYHSGVEVRGREYMFGEDGVIAHPPRAIDNFRQSVVVGELDDDQHISTIIALLRNEFRPVSDERLFGN